MDIFNGFIFCFLQRQSVWTLKAAKTTLLKCYYTKDSRARPEKISYDQQTSPMIKINLLLDKDIKNYIYTQFTNLFCNHPHIGNH